MSNHTVFVGGTEVNDYYLSKDQANDLAKQFRDDGYDDVAVVNCVTTEWCPHCDNEVEIPDYKMSPCPECKVSIRPCSACKVVAEDSLNCDWDDKKGCTVFPNKIMESK